MKKILIFVCLIFFVLVIFLPHYFIKVRIECKSQFGSCPMEVESLLAGSQGKSLAAAKKTIEKSLSVFFLVSDFSLHYKLPNTLIVNVIVKKPEFALKNAGLGETVLIGKEGKALSVSQNSNLPEVGIDIALPKPGESVSPESLLALNLQEGVFGMYQVRSGEISGGSLVVELPASVEVIFPLQGDRDILLGSLRLIYSKIESGTFPGRYSEIDLRFKNPVLR